VLSTPARAQELLGVDLLLGDAFRVNAKTGALTYLGSTGQTQHLWHSMAKDSTGRIFAGYGGFGARTYGIYEINPNTGHASLVVQTDRNDLLALAFGPGDQLFASSPGQIFGTSCELLTVDLITGITTLVGPAGLFNVQSLAFGQGTLWGWDLGAGLVRLDPLTGIATDVNPFLNDGTGMIQSIAFSDDGVLYGSFGSLHVIDLDTGAPIWIDWFKPSFPIICGIEFLPNQPAPFSLGVSGETAGPMGAFVAGATPGGSVAFLATRGGGGPTQILPGHACAGVSIDLNARLRLIGLVPADAAGKAEIGPVQVPFYPAGALRLQALDLRSCATSNRARVIY